MSEPRRFESFADVASLDDTALRALLRSSQDVERVWAAWSLALRLGGRAGSTLRALARATPEPGVRRQLAVVLAGLGELDALTAMALADPEPSARATAARYVARLAGKSAEVWGVVGRLLVDDAGIVRETLVQGIGGAAPAVIAETVVALVADAAPEVRRAVLERIEAGTSLPGALVQQATRERDAELRARMLRVWLARAGATAVLRTLVGRDAALVREALVQLVESEAPFSWADVAPLHAGGDDQLREFIVWKFENRLAEVPLDALLGYVGMPDSREAIHYPCITQLIERLRPLAAAGLPEVQRQAIAAIGAQAHAELQRTHDPAAHDESSWPEHRAWLDDVARLAAEAERLTR